MLIFIKKEKLVKFFERKLHSSIIIAQKAANHT